MTNAMLWLPMLAVLSAPTDVDEPTPTDTHPRLAVDGRWATPVVVGLVALTAAAAVVGPIVLSRRPKVVPDSVSHEEDPSADRVP